jgi:hypothetical protein
VIGAARPNDSAPSFGPGGPEQLLNDRPVAVPPTWRLVAAEQLSSRRLPLRFRNPIANQHFF